MSPMETLHWCSDEILLFVPLKYYVRLYYRRFEENQFILIQAQFAFLQHSKKIIFPRG